MIRPARACRQGLHRQHRRHFVRAMAAARSMAARFMIRGKARVPPTSLALLNQGVVVQGGAHDLIHQVKGGQSLDVHLEQAVPGGIAD